MTVTGRTIAENMEKVAWNDAQDVVRPADKPITKTGGVVGLKGNLAPERGDREGCRHGEAGHSPAPAHCFRFRGRGFRGRPEPQLQGRRGSRHPL